MDDLGFYKNLDAIPDIKPAAFFGSSCELRHHTMDGTQPQRICRQLALEACRKTLKNKLCQGVSGRHQKNPWKNKMCHVRGTYVTQCCDTRK
jgi:hypothetical protein